MMTITPPETSWTTTTLTGRKKFNTHMSAADVEEEEVKVPVPQCENTPNTPIETVVFSKIDIFFSVI